MVFVTTAPNPAKMPTTILRMIINRFEETFLLIMSSQSEKLLFFFFLFAIGKSEISYKYSILLVSAGFFADFFYTPLQTIVQPEIVSENAGRFQKTTASR
jgi:hypothetical protein